MPTSWFWIEYENDMGPFAERELAEMALGSDEGQIFTSDDRGCTPIVALVSPAWQSTAVEWRGVGLGESRDLARRSLARAKLAVTPIRGSDETTLRFKR